MKHHRYRIHPGIGIARLGNHPEQYFLGPEAPGIAPAGPYKADGLIKRQGVRFRIFRFTYDDDQLTDVREVKATENVKLRWSVHLVNKKAASTTFPPDQDRTLRNSGVTKERFRLVVDSGNQAISGKNQSTTLTGSFKNVPVTLGTLYTDEDGRLIALGGFGTSQSVPPNQPLLHFANNDDWCDDTSDGPITATVEVTSGAQKGIHVADSAWVVVAPPSYAPGLYNVVTWYDRALAVASNKDPVFEPKKVSFVDHVLPILMRTVLLQWVDTHAANGHSEARPNGNFLSPELLKKLASNKQEHAGDRRSVYENVDDPDNPQNFGTMPALNNGLDPENPVPPNKIRSTLTELQRRILRLWVDGKFEPDLSGTSVPESKPLNKLKQREVPEALDRAALEDSIGLAFFPGIECGYIMARSDTYDRPLRISPTLSAGELTAGLAVPWQADFNACGSEQPDTWWPAARPNEVFFEGSAERHDWVPEWFNYRSMVDNWWKLGFIVRADEDGRFIEVDRSDDLDLVN